MATSVTPFSSVSTSCSCSDLAHTARTFGARGSDCQNTETEQSETKQNTRTPFLMCLAHGNGTDFRSPVGLYSLTPKSSRAPNAIIESHMRDSHHDMTSRSPNRALAPCAKEKVCVCLFVQEGTDMHTLPLPPQPHSCLCLLFFVQSPKHSRMLVDKRHSPQWSNSPAQQGYCT